MMNNRWAWFFLILMLGAIGFVTYVNYQKVQELDSKQICDDSAFDDKCPITDWAHQATVGAVQKSYGCVYWDGAGGCLSTKTPVPSPTLDLVGCEEYRYVDGDFLPRFRTLWDDEADDFTDDNYAIVQTIHYLVSRSVASHNCSKRDPSFDDSHFYWSQYAYYYLEVLEQRFYDERYLE